jgi:hypothetical protein
MKIAFQRFISLSPFLFKLLVWPTVDSCRWNSRAPHKVAKYGRKKKNQEDKEKNLRNSRGGGSDSHETKNRGYQCKDEKC